MRQFIDATKPRLNEKAFQLPVRYGFIGRTEHAMIRAWENPGRFDIVPIIQQSGFAMDGDPNLRGVAHGGKVWVFPAEEGTHADLLTYLGVNVDGFDYSDPAFSFFQVWTTYNLDCSDEDATIRVSCSKHTEAAMASSAKRWPKVKFQVTGPWMPDFGR